jgi:hypothetical protein
MLRSAEATPARIGSTKVAPRPERRPAHSTAHDKPPSSAGELFADAERILATLLIGKRNADRDRHVQIARWSTPPSRLPRACFRERSPPADSNERVQLPQASGVARGCAVWLDG